MRACAWGGRGRAGRLPPLQIAAGLDLAAASMAPDGRRGARSSSKDGRALPASVRTGATRCFDGLSVESGRVERPQSDSTEGQATHIRPGLACFGLAGALPAGAEGQ